MTERIENGIWWTVIVTGWIIGGLLMYHWLHDGTITWGSFAESGVYVASFCLDLFSN